MAEIGIAISSNPTRESVFINQRIKPTDRVQKEYDENGKVTGVKVEEVDNVVARGINRKEALRNAYGK